MVLAQTETEHADNVSHEVVERIAEAEDVDPLELTPPLCEVIDTDALESLFANSRASGKIVFNYKCYEVSIFSNGHISVEFYGT